MRRIRVLVVDDSAVVRRLVSDALSLDPALEVAGTAANGKIALDKLPLIGPDVVTLDIEMPDMDGLTTLRELRKTHPRLPVIMFSTLTRRGAVDTLNALSLGASDYVTKPSNVGSVTAGIAAVKNELIPKIKAFCGCAASDRPSAVSVPLPAARSMRPPFGQVGLLAIGISTGGPNALQEVFQRLPAEFPVPIVIVQHMPPVFTRYLAERLDAISPLTVCEAANGQVLRPGTALLAPGDFHLTVTRHRVDWMARLHQGPPENSCRPAVDVLFRSVAESAGNRAVAVVMTGMGCDGLRGSQAIHDAGGRILVQDQASSVIWGMPGAVANANLADQIVPLDQIADELVRLTRPSPAIAPSLVRSTQP